MASIKHVVLFNFKPGTADETIGTIFDDLAGLKGKIDGLTDFVGGPYSSPEGMNQGFSHGFIMTFIDAAARDIYLPHPDHEAVKATILPHLETVVAFDFEV